ncbi:MAG: glycosyltransferase [Candidatus Sungbacteria bacterium]|uniref:Glycosyltransferase n=1 Tax=Candidatus Sungiibacteriota bacterium TaxID=2750080 RepID=A0A931SCV4_9BACT|nr:glycosyltransferase [Candidatus Sungbacteria bacterium]
MDIIIPVFNEKENILVTLGALSREVKTKARVLICYDMPDDDTLPAVRGNPQAYPGLMVEFVQNLGRGVHAAVMAGFAASRAPFVFVYPADDDYNAGVLDRLVSLAREGSDIVCASRFMPGGSMVGCPLLKAILVRVGNATLYYLARLPSRDSSNGLRLFSRRVIDQIAVESEKGFSYSLELLVKTHRLGWKISEVPAQWFEREHGDSRFRVLQWLPAYFRWYLYAFATTYLRRPASTVTMKKLHTE